LVKKKVQILLMPIS